MGSVTSFLHICPGMSNEEYVTTSKINILCRVFQIKKYPTHGQHMFGPLEEKEKKIH